LHAVDASERGFATLYHRLARTGARYSFLVTKRFYEIGKTAALAETELFLPATRPLAA